MQKELFLIDDDPDDQEIFIIALQEIDTALNCTVANNGIEALKKLSVDLSYQPRFIFVDINMYKMNGIECLEQIKKLDHLNESRVIMFSTIMDEDIVQQCKDLGAYDFLAKPPGLALLVESLRYLLKTI